MKMLNTIPIKMFQALESMSESQIRGLFEEDPLLKEYYKNYTLSQLKDIILGDVMGI
jgi:hypothetical protein